MKSLKFFGLLGTFFLVMQLIIVSLISAITISLTGKFTLESIIILCVVLSIFAAYNYKVRKRHLTDLGNLLRDFNSKKYNFKMIIINLCMKISLSCYIPLIQMVS